MKRTFILSGIIACFCLLVYSVLHASGIVPAIVPALVPSANKTSTTSTVFALASSSALTASSPVCTNANGDMTTTACTTNAVTSTTPVTVNTNTTSDQQLMELSLSAGYLNSLGRPFQFFGAGVYTTQTAQTPTLEFKVKLCTVSGCGSGTVISLVDITTGATTAATANVSWNVNALAVTAATGATGNLEVHGPATVDLGSAISTASTVYNDTNTAVSSNIDLTAALFVDFTVRFSTNAATANTCTQRSGSVSPGGSTSGGGGGTTVTVAAPYITVAGTKYVAATMWPFTAFFSGSFLDANTCTLTAGTNGSEQLSCALNNTNAWYSVAATTSVEAEFQGNGSTSDVTDVAAVGIWMCDTTNSKIYGVEVVNQGTGATNFVEQTTWTLASCAGTPSAGAAPVLTYDITKGLSHLKLVKSGGNLLTQISKDSGQTYSTIATNAVGTLSKGGVSVRASGNLTANMTVLSVSVQ